MAGAIALGMDVLYVVILRSEGEGDLHSARTQLIVASLKLRQLLPLAVGCCESHVCGSDC